MVEGRTDSSHHRGRNLWGDTMRLDPDDPNEDMDEKSLVNILIWLALWIGIVALFILFFHLFAPPGG